MKVEVKREKESNRIAGVIEWREVLVQTKKKHPVWWGREKVGGGGIPVARLFTASTTGVSILLYSTSSPDTTRRRQQQQQHENVVGIFSARHLSFHVRPFLFLHGQTQGSSPVSPGLFFFAQGEILLGRLGNRLK
jgi:hypothetical protein